MKRYALHIAVPDDVPMSKALDVMAAQMSAVAAAAANGKLGAEMEVDKPADVARPFPEWDACFTRYE
jgi:hypothetical protein